MSGSEHHGHATVIETMQSLIVAFVLAMTFRGFVTEGFVIPTGSMAPTLLGEHVLVHSRNTGTTHPVGVDADARSRDAIPFERVSDPVLGPGSDSGASAVRHPHRMGDRILVLKVVYPFAEPDRFDVVVFKNSTDPDGKSANYIKRLIGLPNERIWLADGDVFADTGDGAFRVRRKPDHVQRAVWQMVHQSDYGPLKVGFQGPPWQGEGWDTAGRSYRCATTAPTTLRWDSDVRAIDDWTAYNDLTPRESLLFPVSDVRVSAGVTADDPASLDTVLEIEARRHVFELGLSRGVARVRMRPADQPEAWLAADEQAVDLPGPGQVFNLELWHVDQALSIYLDGERVAHLEYDWQPEERMQNAAGLVEWRDPRELEQATRPPIVRWRFSGSPLLLHRVRTDRDLHYRPALIPAQRDPDRPSSANPTVEGHSFEPLVRPGTPGFGTHQGKPAVLGPDHYYMLGDNSQASLDSRLWGNPHPLVAEQVDPSPFIVNRTLILGKAWVVYFPAPFTLTDDRWPFVPDFGRLRFIR